MSARSLDRALAASETSFVRELRRARVADGTELLVRSGLKIESIAAHAGFASASHFRRVFQQATGVQRSEYQASGGLRRAG